MVKISASMAKPILELKHILNRMFKNTVLKLFHGLVSEKNNYSSIVRLKFQLTHFQSHSLRFAKSLFD